jgi:predicted aldo/keto reductase-like oxidoreductase
MLYRPFGRTGVRVSILGFGCMRLPVVGGRHQDIDIPLATKMLHYALDHGVNYVDTAFPYHSAAFNDTPGTSEAFVGEALAGRRGKVLVATKLPGWLVKSRKDMDRILAGQLERLRTEEIDCYLLHGVDGPEFNRLAGLGALDFLDDAKARGKIRFAGFSFHDQGAAFAPIVDAYDWDLCQIQYNYMDVEYQAGAAGLAYAADRGLAVVVMEPLKGGRLAGPVPATIKTLWETAPVRRAPVEWALRFVWDDSRVSLLLSGMSAMEQVKENVELASEGQPASLSTAELAVIGKVQEAYRMRTVVDCTGCGYCMPCPQGIDIPRLFSFLNDAALFDNLAEEKRTCGIAVATGQTAPASACTECGQCVEACPQQLDVTRELAGVARTFEENKATPQPKGPSA